MFRLLGAKGCSVAIDPRDRILNVVPSAHVEQDWTFETAKNVGMVAAGPPPANKDLREDWWGIGDQGQTGSCVGWACADAVLRWHFVKAGRLDESETLSVRQIWMASKELDEWPKPSTFIESAGTSLKSALDVARKYGVVPSGILPFGSANFFVGPEDSFYALASQRKISSYIALDSSPRKWREWIAKNGPILARLDCDDAWFDAKITNGHLTVYDRPNEPAGHAVAIVGYTPDHFIVRNSWGTSNWGDGGFAYATDAYAAAAFDESYGVVL